MQIRTTARCLGFMGLIWAAFGGLPPESHAAEKLPTQDRIGILASTMPFEDWEGGWGDWYAENGIWDVGTPTGGPDAAFAGARCAGTVLNGYYSQSANSRLVSPPVTLPAPPDGQLQLSMWQWLSIHGGDVGRVEIRPAGEDWQTASADFTEVGGVWTRVLIDISAFHGQTVEFGFHLIDDGGGGTQSWGWYIDNLEFIAGAWPSAVPENFESGIGGWSADNGIWEVGTPTSGPNAAHSGTQCAGTILNGNFPYMANSRLVSPQVTLPSADGRQVWLSLWHWYSMNFGDIARIEIRSAGQAWQTVSTSFVQNGGIWTRLMIDISAYGGQTVQIGFHLIDDGADTGWPNYSPIVSAGWYVDDLRVVLGPLAPAMPEDFEAGLGNWYADNGTWEVGVPTNGPGAAHGGSQCAATVLSDNYSNYANSRLIGPMMTLPSSGDKLWLSMWHWFSVQFGDIARVEVRRAGQDWEVISGNFVQNGGVWTKVLMDISGYRGANVQFAFHLIDDGTDTGWPNYSPVVAPGWYIDDLQLVTGPLPPAPPEDFENGLANWYVDQGVWEVGTPTTGPGAAHGGSKCAATLLGANYPRYTNSRLISPEITLPSPPDGKLALGMWHWFAVDFGDSARIEVRRPGQNWQAISSTFVGNSGVWTQYIADLSTYRGERVQFALHLLDNGTDTGWPNYSPTVAAGWYVDDLTIIEGSIPLAQPENFESSGWAQLPATGGWSTDNGVWEVGRPTVGPEAAHGGRFCAGTILAGNYPRYSNSRLVSPLFTLAATPTQGKLWLTYWHWFSIWGGDTGTVEIRPAGGAWAAISQPCNYGDGVWTQNCIDISAWAGQSVQFAFHLQDDGTDIGWPSYSPTISTGWYVDDVAVVNGPAVFNNPEGFESGTRGWFAERGSWQIGAPTPGVGPGGAYTGTVCAGTNLTGNYGGGESSRLVSPPVTLPATATSLRFVHWFSLATGDTAYVEVSDDHGPWTRVSGIFTSGGGVWSPAPPIALTAYLGHEVRFAFHLKDNGDASVSTGWYVDEVRLQGAAEGTPAAPIFTHLEYGADAPLLTWQNPAGVYAWVSIFAGETPDFIPDLGHRIALVEGTTYLDTAHLGWHKYYKISRIDLAGHESAPVGALAVTGVDDPPPVGGGLSQAKLEQNHPNPFNPVTTIMFSVPKNERVRIVIYDLAGRLIRVIVDETQTAGSHSAQWNGTDSRGQQLASGVYFCRMETGSFSDTKRMTLLK